MNEANRKWWVLAAMTTCISMIFIDITVLPVTLPTISRELNASQLALQWIINAYLLTLSSLLLAGGRLGDMLGHRKIFCWGLLVFSLSSALCGLSPSEGWLIGSRAFQGAGGALLLPATNAILFSAFPPSQRGKALGLYVSIGSIFLILGPVIGGFFTEYWSWRYVFWINLPIAGAGLFLALLSVPISSKVEESFDFIGFITLASGIGCLVVAFMQVEKWGWESPWTISLLLLGILAIALLVILDRKVEHPIVDFSIFKSRRVIGANFCLFCTQFLLMCTIFWPIYFQNILEFSPATAGMISFISSSPILFVSPIGGYLLDRFGPKPSLISGFILLIFSLVWFIFAAATYRFLMLLPTLIFFGCGTSLIFTASSITALSDIVPHKRGIASALTLTIRQLGGAIGMAAAGSLFIGTEKKSFTALTRNLSPSKLFSFERFDGLLSQAPSALEALHELPQETIKIVETSYKEAFMTAFSSVNALSAWMGLLGLIAVLLLIKKGVLKS
ncbi:MAG: MFS transporter [Anaerolineae bacterium]